MIRDQIFRYLRNIIPDSYWKYFWWIPCLVVNLMLPLGLLFLEIESHLGFDLFNTGRLSQLLMIISVASGPLIGIFTLALINLAEFNQKFTTRVKWLAGMAIIIPTITLMLLFWVYSK